MAPGTRSHVPFAPRDRPSEGSEALVADSHRSPTVNALWGVVLAAVGVMFFLWGRTESTNVVYRLLVARARSLWGDRVHRSFDVSGVLIVIAGVAYAVAG